MIHGELYMTDADFENELELEAEMFERAVLETAIDLRFAMEQGRRINARVL